MRRVIGERRSVVAFLTDSVSRSSDGVYVAHCNICSERETFVALTTATNWTDTHRQTEHPVVGTAWEDKTRRHSNRSGANHRHYRVDPPIQGYEYVVTSAIGGTSPETILFPSSADDCITSDSYGKDIATVYEIDHELALATQGYAVLTK